MNLEKLYAILRETTGQLRKGPELVEETLHGVGTLQIFDMPADNDPTFDGLEKVDLHFVTVAVNKEKAEEHRAELIELLNAWPDPAVLAGGPSYIAVGGVVGDQGAALELFALGKVLGLWEIITPESMGITGPEADHMAGMGFVMCTGYRRP